MGFDTIQIPPDSTGKHIRHTRRLDLEITNILIDLNLLDRGDTLTGLSSGATGTFIDHRTELNETYLYLTNVVGIFTEAELISNGIHGTIGTVDIHETVFTPNVVITDPDSPYNRMKVDKAGSAYTRFSEGDLGFDAFGHAQFSQQSQMESHTFMYGVDTTKYWDQEVNGGTVTQVVEQSCMLLSVNDQSGSFASRTTHQYYPYQPGVGNEMLMSLRTGDVGKEGLTRRWGLFDDLDGVIFEVDGLNRYVVLRSTFNGVTTEERISDDEFNGDPLDDINTSEFVEDLTKYNLFWIDYQWLGVGKVRVGSFAPNGKRVTIHTFQNPNKKTLPWAKRGTLPIRLEQFNTAGTSGTSEMRMVCATMARQNQQITYVGDTFSVHSNTITLATGSIEVPLLSARANLLQNGEINRITMIPTDLEVFVEGDTVEMHMWEGLNLTGSTWNKVTDPASAFTFDRDATSYTGGRVRDRLYIPAGVRTIALEEDLTRAVKLHADGITQPNFSLSAKCLLPTGTATIVALIRWKEAT
jgi:hypothetical protein